MSRPYCCSGLPPGSSCRMDDGSWCIATCIHWHMSEWWRRWAKSPGEALVDPGLVPTSFPTYHLPFLPLFSFGTNPFGHGIRVGKVVLLFVHTSNVRKIWVGQQLLKSWFLWQLGHAKKREGGRKKLSWVKKGRRATQRRSISPIIASAAAAANLANASPSLSVCIYMCRVRIARPEAVIDWPEEPIASLSGSSGTPDFLSFPPVLLL